MQHLDAVFGEERHLVLLNPYAMRRAETRAGQADMREVLEVSESRTAADDRHLIARFGRVRVHQQAALVRQRRDGSQQLLRAGDGEARRQRRAQPPFSRALPPPGNREALVERRAGVFP